MSVLYEFEVVYKLFNTIIDDWKDERLLTDEKCEVIFKSKWIGDFFASNYQLLQLSGNFPTFVDYIIGIDCDIDEAI